MPTSIHHLAPEGRAKFPPLSAATRLGELVFVSGTPGYHGGGSIVQSDFAAQFIQAAAVFRQTLERAGSDVRGLLKVNMLLTRAEDVAEMNRLYAEAFGPAPYPARTTCVVAALPDPRMLLEIEGVARASAD